MIKPEQVPTAVCNAFSIARVNGLLLDGCIAAALSAWPGMHLGAPWVIGVPNATSIILPLPPQEDSNDQ